MKNNQSKIVTFGEVLMRLSPENNRLFQQSNELTYFFGGTELNVAVSLAKFGEQTKYVTAISDDFIGDAALAFIRQYGIDTSAIQRMNDPLGLYFLEEGSSLRSSTISYNRIHGAFANINKNKVDWEEIFEGATHFHWTGITPGISNTAYVILKEGLEIANKKDILISADPAYRSNLWKYTNQARHFLKELVHLSHIFIGGSNEINEILETDFSFSDEDFLKATEAIKKECPSITKVFDKIRKSESASWQKIYGRAVIDGELYKTDMLEITPVVDRIGTGDAFAAGLIYGLIHLSDKDTLDFANAACALKHTIDGDANLVSVEQVEQVLRGETSGKIKR